jgi:orotidine-5'-phosphate decarboxylase
MDRARLFAEIRRKSSYLCVGLDTDPTKIPAHLHTEPDPVFAFNRAIIDATCDLAVAYKPNLAFYEARGARGWESLQKTMEYIPGPLFKIADAKRGDIGSTSAQYARAFFDHMGADAVTVTPYMGADSVTPFLTFTGKWVILLAHTSNPGSADFQLLKSGGRTMYEEVIVKSQTWGTPDQLMYVVGATRADKMEGIRKLAPEHFFLVPGVGAQGGDLAAISKAGFNRQCGLIVNASRSIIYASSGKDFAGAAGKEAASLQEQMKRLLDGLKPESQP